MSVAAAVVIFSAVLSYEAVPAGSNARGFMASASSNHTSLELCKMAGEDFLQAFKMGNIKNKEPDRGYMTCTLTENNKRGETVVIYLKEYK